MLPIQEELHPSEKNRLTSYLPIRKKGNDFDWEIVTGMVLGYALRKRIKNYDFEQFRDECKAHFQASLDRKNFWCVLDKMYFSSEAVFNISPLFLLFKAQHIGDRINETGAANSRMGELFLGLIGVDCGIEDVDERLSFFERDMLKVMRRKMVSASIDDLEEQPYLPYIANAFRDDLKFLASHPKYLLQEFTNTLRLYAFAYCTQLALNIGRWRDGAPESRPLYFILDSEKASTERVGVQRYGYKLFAGASEQLFPLLSALDVLQHKKGKRPLWQVFMDSKAYHDQPKILEVLNKYIAAFVQSRWPNSKDINLHSKNTNVEAAFAQMLSLASQQFKDQMSSRSGVNENYTRELEKHICSDFIQMRGRAGRVLVLNQDHLLLLTNLSIGMHEKLRLHELMKEFQKRGFYLDGQSQQGLVAFFERMGNVERMSDSGDAVYVRKTI